MMAQESLYIYMMAPKRRLWGHQRNIPGAYRFIGRKSNVVFYIGDK